MSSAGQALAGEDVPAAPSGVAGGLLRLSDRIGMASGVFAVLCLLALLLLILAEVGVGLVGKLVPSMATDINVAWEYSSYLMGAVFMFGAAAGLRAGSHIRVGVLLSHATGAARSALEAASTLAGFAIAAFLTWSLYGFTVRAIATDQLSSGSLTPLWIPDVVLTLGASLLALQMATRLIRLLLGLPTEDARLRTGSVGE